MSEYFRQFFFAFFNKEYARFLKKRNMLQDNILALLMFIHRERDKKTELNIKIKTITVKPDVNVTS